MNLSDVLFESGKYLVTGLWREISCQGAGIMSGYPGLKLDVEGRPRQRRRR